MHDGDWEDDAHCCDVVGEEDDDELLVEREDKVAVRTPDELMQSEEDSQDKSDEDMIITRRGVPLKNTHKICKIILHAFNFLGEHK